MFLVEILLNLVILFAMCAVKTQKHRFPFIIISIIVPNNTRLQTIFCMQHRFSMPCLFVLISHYLKALTEIRTNYEQIEAEAAKKLRTMSIGKIYWFL